MKLYFLETGGCEGCSTELVMAIVRLGNVEVVERAEEADLIVIAGPITRKNLKKVKELRGKEVLALGICPMNGGFFKLSKNVNAPLHHHIPLVHFVPGCPPEPEKIAEALKRWVNARD